MAGRGRRVRQNEGGSAGEPPLSRARVESVPGPRWTLNSRVADVLLDGARPPEEVLLSECLERVRHRGTDIDGDVRMDVVIQEPEFYIPNEHTRRRILSLPECQTYALVYRAVPLLRGHRITSVRRWGGPDENADAKRAVRDELADERLWNTVCGLLDDAFNVAKDAEARGKVGKSDSEAAKVIPDAFESVVNARWSHVLSGVADKPLGMCVADGHPTSVWSDAEVNVTPAPEPAENVDDARGDGLELLVLTSAMGWPYTGFKHGEERDVFVRREMVRVWHVVRSEVARWPEDDTMFRPQPYVLVGTPGIGKSFGCGSYLLYELLHYDAAKVPAVAYFLDGSAYIFHKTGAMAGRVVFYEEARAAITAMRHMANERREALVKRKKAEGVKDAAQKCKAKCGFIIFDVGGKHQPGLELPTSEWGCVVLSSPNERNYKGWKKQKMAYYIFINCYEAREMKAFFAWQQRALLGAAANDASACADVSALWREVERRVDEVGPLPRYVFDDKAYKERCNNVADKLRRVSEGDVEHYMRILMGNEEWIEDGTTHAVIKLVRTMSRGVEHYRNHPVTRAIETRLRRLLIAKHCGRSCLVRALATMDEHGANALEQFGVCAFLHARVVQTIAAKMKCLPGADGGGVRGSVLTNARAVGRYPHSYRMFDLGDADERAPAPVPVEAVQSGLLYIPGDRCFPVVDAFYFVTAPAGGAAGSKRRRGAACESERWTLVGVQVTRRHAHGTTTFAVNDFVCRLASFFGNWAQVERKLSWEIIYVQHAASQPMERRQRCTATVREAGDKCQEALTLWDRMTQYQVRLEGDICAAIDIVANATSPAALDRAV
ncbi:putative retrotransposon hot spot protein 4 (RHS4) [Trypanosoma vivax]|nr:putative retrotransposon hot spot protein 4 (RHS4) [Trypanosoma vivax]